MTKNSFVAEVTFNDKKEVILFIFHCLESLEHLHQLAVSHQTESKKSLRNNDSAEKNGENLKAMRDLHNPGYYV